MKDKQIPLKNYVIIALIFLATIGLTIYLCNCYNVYNEGKKEIPVIRGTLSEITSDDFEHYILENQSAKVYLCTASSQACRNFEKDFIKLIKRKNLADEIVYLNLSNVDQETFVNDFNSKYNFKIALTSNYPAIVIFEDGKIVSMLQGTANENLTITKAKQFIEINKIGE